MPRPRLIVLRHRGRRCPGRDVAVGAQSIFDPARESSQDRFESRRGAGSMSHDRGGITGIGSMFSEVLRLAFC